jgi:isoleucyl-tRNA synthetase
MSSEDESAGLYEAIPGVPERVALEHAVLKRWRDSDVFGKLREQAMDGEPFSFFDGPITANNPMGGTMRGGAP